MSEPLKIFITYSHKDRQQNTELKTRLAVMENEGKIKLWDDNEILPGDEWYKDISTNLAASDILLYLVSATSLASKNCNKELAEALSAKIRVIPIILESCDWLNHQLSDFQALPDGVVPINQWDHADEGWQNVVEGIRKVVSKMQSQTDSASGTFEDELLAELAFQQGNVFMMLRQIDSAIEAYSYAIELDPNCAESYSNRGLAYTSKGDYDRAIEDLNMAINLKSDYAIAYNNRGMAYGKKGDYDRAIGDLNMAIDLKSDYAEAYSNRGMAYNGKSDFDRALADLNKAIQLNPDYAEAYSNRGVAFFNKGDYDRAVEDYTEAIAFKPDLAIAYFNRGIMWLYLGEQEKARADLTAARSMGVELPAEIAAVLF